MKLVRGVYSNRCNLAASEFPSFFFLEQPKRFHVNSGSRPDRNKLNDIAPNSAEDAESTHTKTSQAGKFRASDMVSGNGRVNKNFLKLMT